MWTHVSSCVQQVALALEQPDFQVDVFAVYIPADGAWNVGVSSPDPDLTYGVWKVQDSNRVVTPDDSVAEIIATPGISCTAPTVTLSLGATPPQFLAPTPTPIPEPTAIPAPLVDSAEKASLAVWIGVYNCYSHFPEITSFQAFQAGSDAWTVEGKSGVTHYGLWQVDAFTEAITPLDEIALQAQAQCASQDRVPVVVSSEQARLRVWIAIYDCYPQPVPGQSSIPIPPEDFFQAFQESAERWVVEGKGDVELEVEVTVTEQGVTETFTEQITNLTYYGLWEVDTDTGEITARDSFARAVQELGCFNPL